MARSPLKSSLSDPRPFPGRPFRQTCGARAAPTGCFAGQEGIWSPPPGPCPSARHLIPAGPPGWSSSRPWRVPPCTAAPCARKSSAPGRYTLPFLAGQVSASSSVSVENVHLGNCVTAPQQGPRGHRDAGSAASSSSTKLACPGPGVRDCSAPSSACRRFPPRSQRKRLSLAALGAVPSLACICGG